MTDNILKMPERVARGKAWRDAKRWLAEQQPADAPSEFINSDSWVPKWNWYSNTPMSKGDA